MNINKYELVVVLDGKVSAAKKRAAQTSLEKIINALEGKIESTEEWGVKDLAYPIKKSSTGLFLIYTLQLSPKAAKALPSKFDLEKEVIRYLLLNKR